MTTMNTKKKNARKILQWIGFAIAIATTIVYGLLFLTQISSNMSINTIYTFVIIGYIISVITLLSSYFFPKL